MSLSKAVHDILQAMEDFNNAYVLLPANLLSTKQTKGDARAKDGKGEEKGKNGQGFKGEK